MNCETHCTTGETNIASGPARVLSGDPAAVQIAFFVARCVVFVRLPLALAVLGRRIRFSADEIDEFQAAARARGVSLRVHLRDFATDVQTEEELELFGSDFLIEKWFHNLRVLTAQQEDSSPAEMATTSSIADPMMSARIGNVLIRRKIYPELERLRRQDELTQFASSASPAPMLSRETQDGTDV